MTPETILRIKHLCEMLRLSRATIYRLLASDPTFPRPITLSARAVGFLKADADAWLELRRDAATAKEAA